MKNNVSLILTLSTCMIYCVMLTVTQPVKHIVHDNLFDTTNHKYSDYLTADEISKLFQPIFDNQQPDKTAKITIEQLEEVFSCSQDKNENLEKFKQFVNDYMSQGNKKISFEELLILLNEYNKSQKLEKTIPLSTTNSENVQLRRKKQKNWSMDSDEEVDHLVDTLNYDNSYGHVFYGDLHKEGSNAVVNMSVGNKNP
ncbi:uncharacterized protein LOC126838974 [Adelges cooleyi]|uniref:uncharacterized protein LOC126838974 n=1 Tax=Adelges cooleyi TaxID=133065 RepID=UPI00218024DA|nr:uncharacterized protein LOC126838974 [Adelges cooleyi]